MNLVFSFLFFFLFFEVVFYPALAPHGGDDDSERFARLAGKKRGKGGNYRARRGGERAEREKNKGSLVLPRWATRGSLLRFSREKKEGENLSRERGKQVGEGWWGREEERIARRNCKTTHRRAPRDGEAHVRERAQEKSDESFSRSNRFFVSRSNRKGGSDIRITAESVFFFHYI